MNASTAITNSRLRRSLSFLSYRLYFGMRFTSTEGKAHRVTVQCVSGLPWLAARETVSHCTGLPLVGVPRSQEYVKSSNAPFLLDLMESEWMLKQSASDTGASVLFVWFVWSISFVWLIWSVWSVWFFG